MKIKFDGRSNNDNTKKYRSYIVSKNKKLIQRAINVLVDLKQKPNPNNISSTINKYFKEEGSITPQGIRSNNIYLEMIEKNIIDNINDEYIEKKSSTTESLSECKKEKYKLTVYNEQLSRKNKIYEKIIQKGGLTKIEKVISNKKDIIPIDAIKELLKITLTIGECYEKNNIIYKEIDNSIVLTQVMYEHIINEK